MIELNVDPVNVFSKHFKWIFLFIFEAEFCCKRTPTQLFSGDIFQKSSFAEQLQVTASEN